MKKTHAAKAQKPIIRWGVMSKRPGLPEFWNVILPNAASARQWMRLAGEKNGKAVKLRIYVELDK